MRGIHRSPVNSAHRQVTRSFDVFFFDLRLNKRLSKQWWDWWYDTHSSMIVMTMVSLPVGNSFRVTNATVIEISNLLMKIDCKSILHVMTFPVNCGKRIRTSSSLYTLPVTGEDYFVIWTTIAMCCKAGIVLDILWDAVRFTIFKSTLSLPTAGIGKCALSMFLPEVPRRHTAMR